MRAIIAATMMATLGGCARYPAVKPPASAYVRPVRPAGWTNYPTPEEDVRTRQALHEEASNMIRWSAPDTVVVQVETKEPDKSWTQLEAERRQEWAQERQTRALEWIEYDLSTMRHFR